MSSSWGPLRLKVGRVFLWGRYPYMRHDYHSPALEKLDILARAEDFTFRIESLLGRTTWKSRQPGMPTLVERTVAQRMLGSDIAGEIAVEVDGEYSGADAGIVYFNLTPYAGKCALVRVSIKPERFEEVIARLIALSRDYHVAVHANITYTRPTDIGGCPITTFEPTFEIFTGPANAADADHSLPPGTEESQKS